LNTLDPTTLAGLRDLGREEYHALIRLFLDEATACVAGLRAPRDNSDAQSLARGAHTLKGSSAAFGAMGLADLCAQIETAVFTGGGTGTESLLRELPLEFDRVRAALETELR
jgi:HPt (histidine-containing phosphotransfer) domain-containing protein